jgi:phage recombination protein Bet
MSDLVAVKGELSLNKEQKELLTRTICKGANDDEVKLFLSVATRTGLDPFTKQIYAVKRWDSNEKKNVMTFQVGIDGLRLVAQRSGEYQGQTPPQWCDANGNWVDVWLGDVPPMACKVGVYRKGFQEPAFGVVKYSSFVQKKNDGTPNSFWAKMPELMIAKVAESHALRKAFPQELSGLYTPEEVQEMDHLIDLDTVEEAPRPRIIAEPLVTEGQIEILELMAAELGYKSEQITAAAMQEGASEDRSKWTLKTFNNLRARLEKAKNA